jgi:hypothetical protein
MALKAARTEIQRSITGFQSTISWITVKDPQGGYTYSEVLRDFIIESAFLKLFVAWESFLEATFIAYLMGNQPRTGVPVTRFATPQSIDAANKMLVGTQRFVDWANPEIVMRLASLFFRDGFPVRYALASAHQDLVDMKVVRNACAHLSRTTKPAFDQITSRTVSKQYQEFPVSSFLLASNPATKTAVHEHYVGTIRTAAKLILDPDPA